MKHEIAVQAIAEQLRMFHGIPPYDAALSRGDAFFYASIKRDYDYTVVEEAEIIVNREKVRWEAHRKAFLEGK